jgi:protein-disulfide isomerase
MTEKSASSRSGWIILSLILVAGLGALSGWLLGTRHAAAPSKAAIEEVVRSYILEHPEILPEAMERLQARESGKQVASAGDALNAPFPGAVLGNPAGSITLVEFTDYACGYCRASVAEVEALIAANPELKVVIRELPILAPTSADAARWALAAAEQGKFEAFHKAMFAAGRPAADTIEGAATRAGLDLARARKTIAEPRVEAEIKRNLDLARQLRIDGTPSWVIGEQLLAGAVGRQVLQDAINAAAKAAPPR